MHIMSVLRNHFPSNVVVFIFYFRKHLQWEPIDTSGSADYRLTRVQSATEMQRHVVFGRFFLFSPPCFA